MARKQPNTSAEKNAPSATSSMQDLLKKIRTEETHERPVDLDTDPAPKYDADRVSDTRRQLMEDYRRELEALGKGKRTAPRPNLYEYEDLSDGEEENDEPSVHEYNPIPKIETVEEEITEEEPVEEEPVEEETVEAETVEEETVEEEAVEEETVEEEAVEEEPVEEETVEEEPVEEETAEDEPVEEEPVEEETAEEEPVEEEPVEEEITEEESVEEETVEEETVEAETIEEETVEEEPVEAETAEETKPEHRFRAVAQFRKKIARNCGFHGKTEPSKQKDAYSVYDYDMAQEFGYFPISREETISKTNEMDVERERRVTVFTKRESTRTGREADLSSRQRTARQQRSARMMTARKTRSVKRTLSKENKERSGAFRRRSLETPDARICKNPQKEKELSLKRLLAASAFAIVLMFWEYLPLIPGAGYMLFGVIGNTQYPYLYIGIAAVLLLCDTLMLGTHFLYGFREMIHMRCTPRSLVAFAVMMTFLNDLFSCYILALDSGIEYGTFHFPAAFFVMLYAIGNHSAVCRKSDAYEIFRAPRVKYLLTEDELCEQIRNNVTEHRMHTNGNICRFTVKSEVTGVSKRLSNEDRYDNVRLSFLIFLLFGMGTMLVSAFLSSSDASMVSRVSEAVRAFLWTLFLVMPLSVTEIRRIPLMLASDEMRRRGTALAGDGAAAEYAAVTDVAIRTELFFRKYAFSFGQFLGEDPELLKYYVFSIFRFLGEPFSRAAFNTDAAERFSDNVKIVSVSETNVSAYVDGALVSLCLVELGSKGYLMFDPDAPLREFAYRLPLSITVDGASVGTCSFYAQNDSEYPALIRALSKRLHIGTEHYTFLPFFTDRTLKVAGTTPHVTNLTADSAAERLQKQCIRKESADSGIAALGAPKDLRIPLVYARQITAYNRFAAVLMWLSIAVGLAVSFLVVFGVLVLEAFPLLFMLSSFAFGILTFLFSRHFISLRGFLLRREKSEESEKK